MASGFAVCTEQKAGLGAITAHFADTIKWVRVRNCVRDPDAINLPGRLRHASHLQATAPCCSGTDSTLTIAGALIPLTTKAKEQLLCDGGLLDASLLLNYPTSLKRFIHRFDMVTATIKHTKSRLITPSSSHLSALPLQI